MKRMLLYFFLSTIFVTNSILTLSQTHQIPKTHGTIKGIVTDAKTNENLIGANVYSVGTAYGAATDKLGNFQITNLPIGRHTITASMIGYKSERIEVLITADNTIEIDFK